VLRVAFFHLVGGPKKYPYHGQSLETVRHFC
jgi:hypothetical protein